MNKLLEELCKIENSLNENDSKIVSQYTSIISKSLMDLRAIGGSNPKVGVLIRSVVQDMKAMATLIKRDLKSGKKYPESHSVPLDIEQARKDMEI